MKRTTKRALISLDLIHLDAPQLVSFTRAVASNGLTGNANLTAADIAKLPWSVAELLASATTLETTHNTRLTTPSRAATKLEGDQASTLMSQVTDTAGFCEGIANTKAAGDLTLAESIIASFGFQTKKAGVKRARGFIPKSPVKGQVQVPVPRGAKNAVRLLRYSADGGKTWSFPLIVHGVDVTITGLTSGVDYWFEMAESTPPAKKAKQVVAAGSEPPAWSDYVTCVIS